MYLRITQPALWIMTARKNVSVENSAVVFPPRRDRKRWDLACLTRFLRQVLEDILEIGIDSPCVC
jgi:hypothetical protein